MTPSPSLTATPTVLAPADVDHVRELVLARASIVLDATKGYLVEARLLPVARDMGLTTVGELVRVLRTAPTPALQTRVVEALTTNETSWFRDVQPFRTFEHHVLPDLVRARASSRTLTIWSAACSSGQEPYTIAMVLRDRYPELAGWRVRILSTDISHEMLERTAAGRYSPSEVNRGLPAPMLVRWFDRDGLDWVAKPELRAMVEVRPLNLASHWDAIPTADVVFLRNVLIYFSVQTKHQILERLRQHMRPDGALFLGAAESTLGIHDGYERVAPDGTASYYRLRGA